MSVIQGAKRDAMVYVLDALAPGRQSRTSPTGSPRLGLPRLYAERITKSILVQLTLIIVFIELVFLTEKLNYILQAAVDHNVRAAHVGLLLLYTVPQISDLALPLALLIAVYRVALRCREDREFLVLAGMGIGVHQFIWLALAIGIGLQACSLIISGAVDPYAQFAHRSVLFQAQHHALRGGITPGQFYFFGKNTVYASAQAVESQERRLFVHQDNGETKRVIGAARAQLGEPDADGDITLNLYDIMAQDFRVHSGGAVPTESAPGRPEDSGSFRSEPVASMKIGKFAQELKIDQLLRFEPRGRTPAEWTTLELLGLTQAPGPTGQSHLAEMGRRLARGLMCLLVPLIAGLALALTNRSTQAFALPAACAVVMCFDLACSGLAGALAPAGLAGVLLGIVGIASVCGAVLMHQAMALQHAIVRPALARA